jgi:hypothetical protein
MTRTTAAPSESVTRRRPGWSSIQPTLAQREQAVPTLSELWTWALRTAGVQREEPVAAGGRTHDKRSRANVDPATDAVTVWRAAARGCGRCRAAWQGPEENRKLNQQPIQNTASHTEILTLPAAPLSLRALCAARAPGLSHSQNPAAGPGPESRGARKLWVRLNCGGANHK